MANVVLWERYDIHMWLQANVWLKTEVRVFLADQI